MVITKQLLDAIETRWNSVRGPRAAAKMRDAGVLISSVLDGQQADFDAKDVRLTREIGCGGVFLANSPYAALALSHAVWHVLYCAVAGGDIRVRACCESERVCVYIQDDRGTASVQQLSAAFARQQTAGLGLARRIVLSQGGNMGADTFAGTAAYRVWITLPYLWKELK